MVAVLPHKLIKHPIWSLYIEIRKQLLPVCGFSFSPHCVIGGRPHSGETEGYTLTTQYCEGRAILRGKRNRDACTATSKRKIREVG